MIDAGGFDIIGHLDKIGHNASQYAPGIEDTPWYRTLADELVDHAIAANITIELNTKAWDAHRRLFPSPRHIRHLVESNSPLIVNSDAHVPALINAGRQYTFTLLDAII